jgi:hypothetical protein
VPRERLEDQRPLRAGSGALEALQIVQKLDQWHVR